MTATPTPSQIRAAAERQEQADAIASHEAGAPVFHVIELSDNRGYCVSMGMHDSIRVDGRRYTASITFAPSRRVMGGPLVEGSHAWMNQSATVISAHAMPVGKVYDAKLGDVLVLGGTLWRIERNARAYSNSSDYLLLVRVELTNV